MGKPWHVLAALSLVALAARPAHADEFRECLADLRSAATAQGVSGKTFDAALAGVEPDLTVIEAMLSQPEFETPVWEYLARLVSDARIARGLEKLVAWEPALDRLEQQYGVDRYTVVAVWGVETDYGRIMGRRSLVRSLATVSCFGDRQAYFRGELIATLQIVQHGDIKAEDLRGSWAGAFGQVQFMPSTYQRAAVDFDGDGRRDLVASVPDALGSVANYLKAAGWRGGEPWGFEVRLPARYDGPSGRHDRRALSDWAARGIQRVDGEPIAGDARAGLLLPAGTRGPAFLVFRNFDAIHAYNRSESYALAIAHLADRLRGGAPIEAPWPVDDPILSRTERRELQERLIERGFLEGEADGIVGSRTVAALKAFQKAAGLPADGYASARALKALCRFAEPQPCAAPDATP